VGCQDTYLPLPAGWEISPQDSDSIAATAAHPWGTHLLVYADGGQRYTLNEDYSSPGQAREWYCCSDGRTALGTSSDGTQFKANACARRILLRAPPSTCTGTDAAPTPPSPPTLPSPPPPPPPPASSCVSDSSWLDSDGDSCSHYDDTPQWCGYEDSQARCCACKTSAPPPCATPFEDSSCTRGVRVARGPHWRWGDQDGGVGGVGTVTGRADESGWCKVTWDHGRSNAYRVGSFSMFDLCRWTPGPSAPPPPQAQAPYYEKEQAKVKPPAPPPYYEKAQATAKVDEETEDEKREGVALSDILVPILIVVILAMAYYLWKHRRAAQGQLRVAHSTKCVDVEQGRSGCSEAFELPRPPTRPAPVWGPEVFYHGTSLEAAMNIQKVGFDVQMSGSNAGAALGRGLYVTTTLQKALNYAERNPCQGAIFELRVQLGRCYNVTVDDSNRTKWQEMGYDSAWAAQGIIGEREENCIKDPRPPRVVIQNITLGHTGEAKRAGYWVEDGKLRKK